MTVIARDAVASDHLVYAWPFPIGPECEIACSEDEQVVMCPAWLVGDRLGPGRHRWRTPDPTRPVGAFFVLTAPVEVGFDMTTSFLVPTTGQPVRLRAVGSLQVRCADPGLLIAQFVGLPFDSVNEGILRSVSRSVERMLARLLTRRVVMSGTPLAVLDPSMHGGILEELIAYNPTAGAVFGVELIRIGHLSIAADDGSAPYLSLAAHDAWGGGSQPNIPPMAPAPPAPVRPPTPQMGVPVVEAPPTVPLVAQQPPPGPPQSTVNGEINRPEPPAEHRRAEPMPIQPPLPRPRAAPDIPLLETVRGHARAPIGPEAATLPAPLHTQPRAGTAPGEVRGDRVSPHPAPGGAAARPRTPTPAIPPPIPPIPSPSALAAASGEINVRAKKASEPPPPMRRAGQGPVEMQSTEESTQPGVHTPLPGVKRPSNAVSSSSTSVASGAIGEGTPRPAPNAAPPGAIDGKASPPAEARGSIMGIGMSPVGMGTASGEIPVKVPPGSRVLVPGPNGLMQSATVRQLLQGYYELEVGSSGETIWVPINGVVPEH